MGDVKQLKRVVLSLSEQVGRDLRDEALVARTITLKLRFDDFQTLTRGLTLPLPTDLDDVIGRVAITIPAEYNSWLRELRLGASVYVGRATLVDLAAPAGQEIKGMGVRNRYGADVYYSHYPLGLTYEFVRADEDVWNTTSAAEQRVRRDGHAATIFYSFGEQFLRSIKTQGKFDDWWPKTWQPFLRYDRWLADTDVPGGASDIYTAGLNVFFAETTKAQINLNRRIQHVVGADDVASTELLAQVQFGF